MLKKEQKFLRQNVHNVTQLRKMVHINKDLICLEYLEGKPVLDFHFELCMHIMESGYLYRGGNICDTQEKSSDTGLLACLLSLSYFPDTLHEGWDRLK